MKLVTACPACASSFRVQPEQLAVHQGNVRCGKCSTVFNALDSLAEQPETPAYLAEAAVTETPGVYAYTVIEKAIAASPATVADAASKDKLSRPSRHASRRWPPAMLIVLLLLLAALQVSYHLRTPIAARWPLTKPYLVQACNLLQCKVELPQQADLLAIDDSDLQEDADYQGLMHFSSVVINNASFAQAYPLLELTLTDVTDQALLRRTFSASEYLPHGTDIKAGLAPEQSVRVKLDLTVNGAPIAGYRVFITYVNPQP